MTALVSPLLWLCLAAGAGGCNPKQDPTGPRPAETLTATEIAGIRLTYMCGNTFRVRNPNDQEVPVTWDVYKTGETGSLALPPKPAGGQYSESFFTTVNKGTVRLFYNGQLIQTKANGNKPPCQIPADTAKPALPARINWPLANPLLVTVPYNPSLKNFRDVFGVEFDDSTSGTTIRAFLTRFNATIIGGFGQGTTAPFYVIRVPDPGTTFEAVESLKSEMGAYSGVKGVMAMNYEGSWRQKGRYPIDAAVAPTRASWFGGGTPDNYPWLAVRAPLAWGCETGTYGGTKVKVGVLDAYFDAVHRDLSTSTVTTFRPDPGEMVLDIPYATESASHGTGVVGIIAAQGGNGHDMAGMVWNADLSLYAFGQGQSRSVDPIAYFGAAASSAATRGVKVLNLSFGLGDIRDTIAVRALRNYLSGYLSSGGDRLLVLAVGDSSVNISVADLQTSTDGRLTALDRAAAQLYGDPAYRGKILFVTGTGAAGQKRAVSNNFSGGDQIAAPAEAVLSLAGSSGVAFSDGTSFAAPFAAGSAAQLWAMDPSLTAGQVKDYILRGAQEKRVDPLTGVALAPADIGIPGVYQLDAYGALTLLARERNTPLCGNHVWWDGNTVKAQRGTSTTSLFSLSAEPFQLAVHHGGRRIDVRPASNIEELAYVRTGTAWAPDPAALQDPGSLTGVSNSNWGLSHEGTEEIYYDTVDVESRAVVMLASNNYQTLKKIGVVALPTLQHAESECTWKQLVDSTTYACRGGAMKGTEEQQYLGNNIAFSPTGERAVSSSGVGRVTVAIQGGFSACPWSGKHPESNEDTDLCVTSITYDRRPVSSDLWEFPVPGGAATPGHIKSLPGKLIHDLAITEDGSELIVLEVASTESYTARPGIDPSTGDSTFIPQSPILNEGCVISYRSLPTGTVLRTESVSRPQNQCNDGYGTASLIAQNGVRHHKRKPGR